MENENKGNGAISFVSSFISLKIKLGIIIGIILFFLVIIVPVLLLTVLSGSGNFEDTNESSSSSESEGTGGSTTTQVIEKGGLLFPTQNSTFCYPVVGSARIVQSFGATGSMWKNRSYRNRFYWTKRNKCGSCL